MDSIENPMGIEEAQRATRLINEFMAKWPDRSDGTISPYRDTRVSQLGGWQCLSRSGKKRTLWLVIRWTPRAAVDISLLDSLVFEQVDEERVMLTSGDYYFSSEKLYQPEPGQEGGAA